MKSWITRHAQWLAILIVLLYLALTVSGVALQEATAVADQPWWLYLRSIAGLATVLVAGLMIARVPLNPIGWLFAINVLIGPVDTFVEGYSYYGLIYDPGSLPGAASIALWSNWTSRALGALGITLTFLLFPTGKPISRAWGRVGWVSAAAMAVYITSTLFVPLQVVTLPYPRPTIPLPAQAAAILGTIGFAAIMLANLCAAAALVSLFVRLRRSQGVERQQLKWFVYAGAFFPVGIVLLLIRFFAGDVLPEWFQVVPLIFLSVYLMGLPVAAAIAILRYRLYDIDIIIHRTLVYGLLTAALALIYFTTVVILQQLLQALTGQQSPLAIVVSTLLIAALFAPLRNRIQAFIDRRFYRRKVDAAEAIAAFAAAAQDELDADQLAAELMRVVQDTMQPESLSLWLSRRRPLTGDIRP